MKTTLRFLVLVSVGLANATTFAATLMPGEYLSEGYMKAVKSGKSLLEAQQGGYACFARVYDLVGGEATSEIRFGNFHEGYTSPLYVTKGGSVLNRTEDGSPFPFKVHIQDSKHFDIIEEAIPKVRMVYVGDAGCWVASAIGLVGQYTDAGGGEVLFTEDGLAKFPGRTYKFEPGLDFPDVECLYLDHECFTYKLSREALLLFETSGDVYSQDGVKASPSPKWVLKRVSKGSSAHGQKP